ncbi:MAG: nucleotidyltransferase domain-containing protein [Alphaproteobacteria bacterium]|nr:nucleotidyltransferase domain-containing protein [Alphaproteobacteria bacterium]
MKYGITEKEFELLLSVFPRYTEIESVILYGSRAKGNNKRFSDIDITLKGEKLTTKILNDIAYNIDELYLPYFLDISIYNKLKTPEFIKEIDNTGIEIYNKKNFDIDSAYKERIKIAQKMKLKGYSIEEISEITTLSKEEIENI